MGLLFFLFFFWGGGYLRKLHMDTFYPDGAEIELVFAPSVAVSEIQANFQNCHIWTWNLEFEKSSRSCIWTLFLPHGGRNGAYFRSTGSGSEIRADFQNYPIWVLEFEKSAKSCIWTLFLPQGVEIELIFALRAVVSRAIFKITIFGHETWNLKKVPEVAYGPFFYPRGSKFCFLVFLVAW